MSKVKRYHVSADGKVRPCSASSEESCRAQGLGTERAEHFTNEEEARNYVEKVLEKEKGAFKPLKKLSHEERFQTDLTSAYSFTTTPTELTKLSKNPDNKIRAAVAENVKTPVATLRRLAKDQNIRVVGNAVGNPNFPREELRVMSSHSDPAVRSKIAQSVNLDKETYERLMKDPSERVRIALADNAKYYTANSIQSFSEDPSSRVRSAAAGRMEATTEILNRLSEDESGYVRRAVARNPRFSEYNPSSETTTIVNSETKLRDSLLNKLREDGDVGVRVAVAENPNNSVETFEMLAQDSEEDVRLTVAENPRTPEYILRHLVRDKSYDVARAANDAMAFH